VNLAGVTLDYADLRAADLRGANFTGSSLRYADLRGADVRGAIFQNSNLYGAKMQGIEANQADFRGSDLRLANFGGAYLEGAVMPPPTAEKQHHPSPSEIVTTEKRPHVPEHSNGQVHRHGKGYGR
jgi:uncharacterized protein YjbI with pentapeptide repeats